MPKLLLAVTLFAGACTAPEKRPEVRPYESDMCVVMDSRLGSMGDPIVRVYSGREVKFCCQPCVDEFESDPEYYLEKLDENR